MTTKRILLWDLPTRFCHWALAACVVAAVITGQVGGNLIEWHGKLGIAIVGLVVFRLVWGVVGSTYARFGSFFPTPRTVRAYLRGEWSGHGHNPLGALSVLGLLGLVALQLGTGLFANDDIAFNAPLYELVSRELSVMLTGWHKLASNVLIALVVLHVGAVMFYLHVKKTNLVRPMLTGWKEAEAGESARGGRWPALLLALGLALGAVYAASGAWLPEPPPVPVAETPSW